MADWQIDQSHTLARMSIGPGPVRYRADCGRCAHRVCMCARAARPMPDLGQHNTAVASDGPPEPCGTLRTPFLMFFSDFSLL